MRHALQIRATHNRASKPFLLATGYYCVDEHPERARRVIAEYTQHYYGSRRRASGGSQSLDPPQRIANAATSRITTTSISCPSTRLSIGTTASLKQGRLTDFWLVIWRVICGQCCR